MERRNEPRLKIKQPVTLTVLGGAASYEIRASVADMSGSGLHLRAQNPVPCGTVVKLESQNALMFGEICRCDAEDGAYSIGIQLSTTESHAERQPANQR